MLIRPRKAPVTLAVGTPTPPMPNMRAPPTRSDAVVALTRSGDHRLTAVMPIHVVVHNSRAAALIVLASVHDVLSSDGTTHSCICSCRGTRSSGTVAERYADEAPKPPGAGEVASWLSPLRPLMVRRDMVGAWMTPDRREHIRGGAGCGGHGDHAPADGTSGTCGMADDRPGRCRKECVR